MREKNNRTKAIKVRVTEEEHAQLMERKTGTLASWLRELGLGQKQRKRPPTADPQLLLQLARIGGNMNQIARQMNTVTTEVDRLQAVARLAVIEEQLNEILNNASTHNTKQG